MEVLVRIKNLPYLPVSPTVRFSLGDNDIIYFECYCYDKSMEFSGFLFDSVDLNNSKELKELADKVGDMLREEPWVIPWVTNHAG